MSDFEIALKKTLHNEGLDKYTETKDDRGGATKYGISLSFLKLCFEKDKDKLLRALGTFFNEPSKNIISGLTLDQAKSMYREYFWSANRYGEINDQWMAEKLFDLSVLFGQHPVNIRIQRAINKILKFEDSMDYIDYDKFRLNHDGIIGQKTISLINEESNLNFRNEARMIVFKKYMTTYCLDICNEDKKQNGSLKGWLNRVMS